MRQYELRGARGVASCCSPNRSSKESSEKRLPAAFEIAYRCRMHVGDVVDGRFVLEKKAGAGGMGVVFRAFDKLSGLPVAVKAVLGFEHEFERFEREVAALVRIQHSRVVRYIAHGGLGDERYLAMEWLEGEDLSERLARGRLDLESTLLVVRGIAEGLDALHSADIVHRDIKPSNVFLGQGKIEEAKLLDLGIAHTHDVAWTLTATGSLLGTPAYMAPEQARGEVVDVRADLFSLGCVFYECLVGRSPFAAAHPVASLARILVEDAPSLRDSGISVPPGVEVIVERLLTRDRDKRVGNAKQLLDLLDRLDNLQSLPPLVRQSLTFGEQQIVSVVLTRPANAVDQTTPAHHPGTTGEHVQSIAAIHGARLEQLPNGSYLAIFTSTTSPRDHAANAATFALEIAALWRDDAIALTTGRGEISGRLPVGGAIDRAVELLRANQPGIVVDAVSASLLEGRFMVNTDGNSIRLTGTTNGRDHRRRVAGQTSLFVGREREVAAITSALRTCIDEPLASVVLITAPAGTGKSRLIDEVLQGTALWEGITLSLVGACDMMNAGAGYGVLGRAIRAGIDDPTGDEKAKYKSLVARIRANDITGEVERVTELIAESCGLLDGENISNELAMLRDNPLLLADAVAEAWCSWLDAESRQGAVMIVLEDLHWGDRPTFNLLDRVLRVLPDRPIFVLATARPEVHELFPNLWADRGVQEIRLGRIPARSAERLVKRFLGTRASEEMIKRIVERSAGHPFVLEELVRTALTDPLRFDDIPETVLGLVQARFFKQSDRARAALRAASIFGPSFWLQGVEHLLGDTSLGVEFEELVRGEFIERTRKSKFADQVEYTFRHALVRDAAYAMLTEIDRRTGHMLAGHWLENAGEREPLLLAQHFDLGGAMDRAAFWYHRAAEVALEGNDLSRAVQWGERAIACGRQGEELAATSLIIADAKYGKSDMVGAFEHAMAGRALLSPGSDAWFAATTALIGSFGQRGLNDDVLRELESAIAVTTSPPTDAQLVCIARGIGQYVWVSRDRMEPFHARLVELAGQIEPGPFALGWLARVKSEMVPHRWHMASAIAEQCGIAAREFERAGAIRDAMMAQLFKSIQLAYAERIQDALDIVQKTLADIAKRGLTYLDYFGKLALAMILYYSYQDDACRALVEPRLPAFRHSVRLYCSGQTLLALVALDANDPENAHVASADIVALENISDSGRFSAYGLHAYVLTALGRIDEAIIWGQRAFEYDTPGFMDPFGEVTYLGLARAYMANQEQARARAVIERFWTMFLSLPLDHEAYPRRRIFRDLAALAESFDLPKSGRTAASRAESS